MDKEQKEEAQREAAERLEPRVEERDPLPRHLPAPRRTIPSSIRCSAVSPAAASPAPPATPLRLWGHTEPRKGANILVEALERCGISNVFAYPGDASMEIHQALTRSPVINNHIFRQKQEEAFAASSYARSPGLVGVCVATSSLGATNLVSTLADALLDSIPMVSITG